MKGKITTGVCVLFIAAFFLPTGCGGKETVVNEQTAAERGTVE